MFALLVGVDRVLVRGDGDPEGQTAFTMRPGGAVAGTVLGVLGALFGALLLAYFAAFWPQLNAFSRCYNAANTPSAQQACLNQLHRTVRIQGIGTGR